MIYKKNTSPIGKFIDKQLLKNGMKAVILNETMSYPSKFTNPKTGEQQMQHIAKIKVEGIEGEFNTNLNMTTIKGLINAFGEESKNWQGNSLTVEVKDTINGLAVFLLADGYKLVRNEDKYLDIIKTTQQEQLSVS
jgi:hypothetical protein